VVICGLVLGVAGGAWAVAGETDFLPFRGYPRLRIVDRGARGGWTVGSHVTIRWTQASLREEDVVVVISRDRGQSWIQIGRTRAERGDLTWKVHGHPGRALVRIETLNGGVRSPARRVEIVAQVREISFANSFAVALHEDGRVRMWGALVSGGLPGSHGTGVLRRPTVMSRLSRVASIAAGGSSVLAIKDDGTAWYWGPFYPFPPKLEPRQIPGIGSAIWGRVYYDTAYVRTSDGRVYGIATRSGGVLGDSEGLPPNTAAEVPQLRDAVDIAIGDLHTLILRPEGTVEAFGANFRGQLGDGTTNDRDEPAPVVGLDDVVAISARLDTSMALRRDGTVWMWGVTSLFDYGSDEWRIARSPFQVQGLPRIVQIAAGDLRAYALDGGGTLFAWGENGSGGLGDGTTSARGAPIECLQHGVRYICSGISTVHVITESGDRFGWGSNHSLILGDGTVTDSPLPVPIYSR
jgi:alpha-tubulin suppressor-like RCC1 family protein